MKKFAFAGLCLLILHLLPAVGFSQSTGNFVKEWTATAPETDINVLMTKSLRDVKLSTMYFDGLGRPQQSVMKQGSLMTSTNASSDLVKPFEYDNVGREIKKYLPYVDGTSNGLFKNNATASQSSFYLSSSSPVYGQGENTFYAQTDYEPSPLGRELKQMAPGANWAGSGRGISMGYYTNTVTDAVKIWNVADAANDWGSYSCPGDYGEGELSKTIHTDEQGHEVIEFIDKDGKIILKKVQLTATVDNGAGSGYTGWLCTYYLYDDLGLLRCVIQPEGVKALSDPSANWNIHYNSDVLLTDQCFRYEYDLRGRMIMKKVPGSAPVYMVYDRWDRLILTQDGNLRSQQKWIFTKYDGFNRPVLSGYYYDATHLTLNDMVTDVKTNESILGRYENVDNSASNGYTTTFTYPSISTPDVLSITHYDDYSGLVSSLSSALISSGYVNSLDAATASPEYAEPIIVSSATNGMVTWTKTRILGQSGFLAACTLYDEKGRMIQAQSINYRGGVDVVTNQYSFSNQLLRSHIKQSIGNGTAQNYQMGTKNTYDDLGRVIKVEKKVSGVVNSASITTNSGAWKVLSQFEYDALSQLVKKRVGSDPSHSGSPFEIKNEYNIRGWLIGMNKDYLSGTNAGKYFGMELSYDKDGYVVNAFKQYSGNVGESAWKSYGDGEVRKYDYSYDAANRLLKADFTQLTGSTAAAVNFNVKMGDGINPSSAYDANGNIKRMQQWGIKLGVSSQIDDLSYGYFDNSNKLKYVTDAVTMNNNLGDFTESSANRSANTAATPAADYGYDVNGNMITDLNKRLDGTTGLDLSGGAITYNYLNLPSVISVKDASGNLKGTISYIYDATGNKLQKIVVEEAAASNGNNKTTTTTTYLGGAVYESKTHLTPQSSDYTDRLQFISQEEGRIRFELANPNTCTPTADRLIYDYMIKDHLGNVRMLLTEAQEPVCYPAATLESATITTEKQLYDIKDPVQVKDVNQVGGASAYSQFGSRFYETNGSIAGKKTGLGITLKVLAGDKVSIFGQSYYNKPSSGATDNNWVAFTELLNVLVNSGAVVGGKGVLTESQVSGVGVNTTALSNFTQPAPQANTANAYINYILFDEQMRYVSGGSDPVQAGGGYHAHTLFSGAGAVTVPKNGYIYVYCSNASNYPVYFDNLAITHTPGPVLEEAHYYPFGLTMVGVSSKVTNVTPNKMGITGKEKQSQDFSDGSGFEQYDFGARFYDPQVGRWHVKDPLAGEYSSYTPYNYCFNNPIILVDIRGMGTRYFDNILEEALSQLNRMGDNEIAHYEHNENGSWEKGIFITDNGRSAEGTVVIVGGNDFGSNREVSSTTTSLVGALSFFFRKHSSKINLKAFSSDLSASTMDPIYDYIKYNHDTSTPLFFYGYSLGGHTANQVIKRLNTDHIKVNLFYAVDAALGWASRGMKVSSNVERIINVYQTDRSPIGSRGYEARRMEGNTTTIVTNINYDLYKSVKGTGAHGAIDEDTYESVLKTFQNQMLYLIGK